MLPKLLQEMKDEFEKGTFKITKYRTKMKDQDLLEFFKDKYENVKLLSEKIYLFLHNKENPEQGKIFDAVNFTYKDKPTISSKPSEHVKEIDKNISEQILSHDMVSSLELKEDNLVLYTQENDFVSSLDPDDELYMIAIRNLKQSNTHCLVLYSSKSKSIYIGYIPTNVNMNKVKILLETELKQKIKLNTIPLDILNKIDLSIIESIISISPFNKIYMKKHSLS